MLGLASRTSGLVVRYGHGLLKLRKSFEKALDEKVLDEKGWTKRVGRKWSWTKRVLDEKGLGRKGSWTKRVGRKRGWTITVKGWTKRAWTTRVGRTELDEKGLGRKGSAPSWASGGPKNMKI